MKDWKERVTSNRKLAAINASAGSRPATPFGRGPGGEQTPSALASQKFLLQAPAHRYRRPLGSRPPRLLCQQPPKDKQSVKNREDGAKALPGAWRRPAKVAAGSRMRRRAAQEELDSSRCGGQRQGAGKKRKKILVPAKRKVSLQHPSYLDKTDEEKGFKEILKELEPRGRCHRRQCFPISSSKWESAGKVIPKKGSLPGHVLCSAEPSRAGRTRRR